MRQAGKVEAALKNGFLKTDADLLLEEGMAECLKIRKEVARRCVRVCVFVCGNMILSRAIMLAYLLVFLCRT